MRFIRSVSLQHIALLALTLTRPAFASQSPEDALRAATEFARGYMDRIPNFTCVRTTKHFVAEARLARRSLDSLRLGAGRHSGTGVSTLPQ
jgi:hypothetical protein